MMDNTTEIEEICIERNLLEHERQITQIKIILGELCPILKDIHNRLFSLEKDNHTLQKDNCELLTRLDALEKRNIFN